MLDHGDLVMVGAPGEAVRTLRERLFFLAAAAGDVAPGEAPDTGFSPIERVRVRHVDLEYPGSPQRGHLLTGDPLTARVRFETDPAGATVDDVVFSLAIYDESDEQLFGTNTEILGLDTTSFSGRGTLTFNLASIPFLDGRYFVSIKVADRHTGAVYDWRVKEFPFQVVNPGRSTGRVAVPADVEVETEWAVEEAAQ